MEHFELEHPRSVNAPAVAAAAPAAAAWAVVAAAAAAAPAAAALIASPVQQAAAGPALGALLGKRPQAEQCEQGPPGAAPTHAAHAAGAPSAAPAAQRSRAAAALSTTEQQHRHQQQQVAAGAPVTALVRAAEGASSASRAQAAPREEGGHGAPRVGGQAAGMSAVPAAGAGPSGAADGKHISISVVGRDNHEVHFTARRSTSIRNVIWAYCAHKGIDACAHRFSFDGARVGLGVDCSLSALDMEDGDIIDCIVEEVGD